MLVFGIDPGTRFCGWGVIASGNALRHIASGLIRLDDAASLESRLAVLYEALAAQIARHVPEVVAVEDLFHQRNARSALVLGHARGVALLAAARAGIPVAAYPPATVKQAVTGSGRAEKDQVARMVAILLGVSAFERADVSDALAVAICGALRAVPFDVARPRRLKSIP